MVKESETEMSITLCGSFGSGAAPASKLNLNLLPDLHLRASLRSLLGFDPTLVIVWPLLDTHFHFLIPNRHAALPD